ncbi:diaminopimelate epimerase [Velocimicrobium porci]|uniref:Diaminopimelate epimerase n=1 Tax=Velocimicrobium porci TaxID=2606634 RepID=A0A6L5XWY4_9FIRM|nr:diaminopimelate epimerase [Velocimicrobium porci]MSS63057.1 diaminopimelate epimerase [Velocimicrobium porci]
MKFTKMHGCGNDYVYVNCFKEEVKNAGAVSRFVSDRHFGIGSDGLILIKSSEVADFKMAMYNSDGSEGEMCGNGIRCVAKYVYDYGLTDKEQISIETKAGIKHLELQVNGGKVETVTVDMGSPITTPAEVPVISDRDIVLAEKITKGGMDYEMTCVSMGNPHAIVFVEDTSKVEIEKAGPLFENDKERFPNRTNTEFIQVLDRGTINMRVWERGAGETLACGTGACASVYACILNEKTDDEVLVHLLGGDLKIRYDREKNHMFMTGPATVVFDGEIDITGIE